MNKDPRAFQVSLVGDDLRLAPMFVGVFVAIEERQAKDQAILFLAPCRDRLRVLGYRRVHARRTRFGHHGEVTFKREAA